jgi:hypothetical protein
VIEVTVTLDDARLQQALARFPERVTAQVEFALVRGAEEIARAARGKAPKAFSTLTNSIRAQRMGELHYRVAPGVNYAAMVERGRKPGKQPGTANGLMEWVKQKTGLEGKALDRMSFVVARAIGRRGIRAQPYMRPALVENESRLRQLVQAGVARGIEEAFRG